MKENDTYDFFEALKTYFNSTPISEVIKDWEKNKELDNVGITVEDFFQKSIYCYKIALTPQSSKDKDVSPIFSGFFITNYSTLCKKPLFQ